MNFIDTFANELIQAHINNEYILSTYSNLHDGHHKYQYVWHSTLYFHHQYP